MTAIRYSKAFKMQAVREVESGQNGAHAVAYKYGIRGGGTVNRWVRQFRSGKYGKIIRVEKADEINGAARMRRQLQLAKEALADAHLELALEKGFPLLDFTVWSTAEINPWMHHLLAQPVAFLHAPADALESVGDKLRELRWDVAVNPTPTAGPKSVYPGEKMVVLRPTHSKQPAPVGRQARIEQILVDLQLEASRLALMDASEAQGVARSVLEHHLVQVSETKTYADFRTVKMDAIAVIK